MSREGEVGPVRAWNPRFVAYAATRGNAPGRQIELDRERWPGGCMAGFTTWIDERWNAWHAARGLRRHDYVLSDADHDDFDAFIGAAG